MPEALIGRSIAVADRADAHRIASYRRLFAPAGESLLALHWLLFTAIPAETREDGHAAVMAPFPPLPWPRRMWAGGELTWHAPVAPDAALTRTTTIVRADPKQGAAGDFLLTSLRHDIRDGAGVSIVEERQDVVFLPPATTPGAAPPRAIAFAPEWSEERAFGAVDLFRYSALTLNGHRIHYDLPYARDVEGYPGLVVHGPLLATMLMQAAARRRVDEVPLRFDYRAVAPVFAGDIVRLTGRGDGAAETLAIVGPDDGVRMTATMDFAARAG